MSSLDFRDLRRAIVVSQHCSLRQAADALNIRQPTLSRSLRDLEYRLGATIFERTKAGTHPTAAGYEFLAAARRIVDEADTAFSKLVLHHRGDLGELSIGVYMALSTGNLHATLMDHRRRYPNVEIRLTDGSRPRLLSDLAANIIDVAIVTTDGQPWNGKTLPLWAERVVAALPEDSPLCAYDILHWNELREASLLLNQRDPGPEFQRLLLTKLGDDLRIKQQDAGLDRILSLVGTGHGLTLVAEGATGATYTGVAYREIHDEGGPTRLPFMACWRAENGNPTLAPFLSILRERYPDLLAPSE